MRGSANHGEWPWLVLHGEHEAFYLRSFLISDFRPGLHPAPCYALTLEAELPHPEKPVVCGGCGRAPVADELVVVERATGRRFLDEFRKRRKPWPTVGTRGHTCWLCNADPPEQRGSMASVAASLGVGAETPTETVGLCGRCARHVTRASARAQGRS